MTKSVLIVGAGHAAGQAVLSLRQSGFDGQIQLVGEEPYIPYQRPPLSKKFMSGELELDRVYFKPPEFYTENSVDLLLNKQVTAFDRSAKTATLDDGQVLSYDQMLLTTGSRVRKLSIPGHALDGVAYLRTIDDVNVIRPYLTPGSRLCVVGGGYVGLEVAAVAVKLGLKVTVLEAESRLLSRVVGPEMSEFFQRVHTEEGVEILCDHMVSSFEGSGKLEAVRCANDAMIEADLAIVGVGILPNMELAAQAGLTVENGISVDEYCRTSDPDIFAAGDCTWHPNELLGRHIRLESVHNALEQAKTAAAAICGKLEAYNQVPWFWSDQYDMKLQIAGLNQGYDQIILRQAAPRKLATFYLKEGALIAVDAVNSPPEYMVSRKLIGEKAHVSPEKLADPSVSMKDIGSS